MAVVISGDTGITSVNGTATAPSITGADTNTGIVYGTDTLSLATGGTTAVTVGSSQNVGVGTSSPSFDIGSGIDVERTGDTAVVRAYRTDASTLGGISLIGANSTNGIYSAGAKAVIIYTNETERMRIAADGIVTGTAGNLMLVSGTAITSATGASLDFPSIPSWVKRITISLNSISFAASGAAVVRLGVSNTLVTTGYVAARVGFTTTPAMVYTAVTDGVASFGTTVAAAAATGQIVITNLTGNQWVASGQVTRTTDNVYMPTTGSITLAGTLTNLSVVATTSTFDAGSVNIMYE
jgi:hypothetical protein